MANKYKQRQIQQVEQSERAGTYTQTEQAAYPALNNQDPGDYVSPLTGTYTTGVGGRDGFSNPGFAGNNPQSAKQQTQFRTGEQDGPYTTAEKKAYPAL